MLTVFCFSENVFGIFLKDFVGNLESFFKKCPELGVVNGIYQLSCGGMVAVVGCREHMNKNGVGVAGFLHKCAVYLIILVFHDSGKPSDSFVCEEAPVFGGNNVGTANFVYIFGFDKAALRIVF